VEGARGASKRLRYRIDGDAGKGLVAVSQVGQDCASATARRAQKRVVFDGYALLPVIAHSSPAGPEFADIVVQILVKVLPDGGTDVAVARVNAFCLFVVPVVVIHLGIESIPQSQPSIVVCPDVVVLDMAVVLPVTQDRAAGVNVSGERELCASQIVIVNVIRVWVLPAIAINNQYLRSIGLSI
jgi:hypothetical protein